MSRFPLVLIPALALAACDQGAFTYSLDAEVVIPEEVARVAPAASLLQVEWMTDDPRGVELFCDPLDGQTVVPFADTVETEEHVSHQAFLARLVPWPADRACDPDLVDTFAIEPDGEVPWVSTFVFDDDASALGAREHDRQESISVELGFEG